MSKKKKHWAVGTGKTHDRENGKEGRKGARTWNLGQITRGKQSWWSEVTLNDKWGGFGMRETRKSRRGKDRY